MSGISGSPSPLISTLQFPLLCCHTSTHTFGNIDLFLGFAATHLYSKELPLTLPEFTPTHDSFTRFCVSSCPSSVHICMQCFQGWAAFLLPCSHQKLCFFVLTSRPCCCSCCCSNQADTYVEDMGQGILWWWNKSILLQVAGNNYFNVDVFLLSNPSNQEKIPVTTLSALLAPPFLRASSAPASSSNFHQIQLIYGFIV